jgi:hypothetical protein
MKEATFAYKPRDQFLLFHHKQRWAIIVAHRRAGKTVATINDLIFRALSDGRLDGRLCVRGAQALEISQTVRLADTSTAWCSRAAIRAAPRVKPGCCRQATPTPNRLYQ